MSHRINPPWGSKHDQEPGDDYCLVHMPMFDMRFPPLGLDLLQAVLQSAGLRGQVIHANLQFVEDLTPNLGQTLYLCRDALLSDWMFAHMAFPQLSGADKVDEYIEELCRKAYVYRFLDKELIRTQLLSCRQWAETFVDKIVQSILVPQPRVVGCSVFHSQYIPVLALLNRLRQAAPNIINVMGGPHCGGVVGQTTHRNIPWLDYVVAGDADEIIVPLVKAILDQGPNISPEQAWRGVLVPGHRQQGYPPPDQWFAITNDLGALPPPDHGDYLQTISSLPKVQAYVRQPVLTFESSRGCYRAQAKPCTFCSVDQGTRIYRKKNATQVMAELDYLADCYETHSFLATDSIMDRSWFQTFLPALAAKGSPYQLFYEVPASLSQEQVKIAAEAGVVWLQPGIESFDTRILRLMNKGISGWQNVQLLKWCRQYGIRVAWNILYGSPGEEDSWYQEMAQFLPALAHLQPPSAVGPVNFCRNSAYYDEADKYNLRLKPDSPWRHIIPWPEETIADVLYSFVLETEGDEAVERLGLKALQQAASQWKTRFAAPELPLLLMKQAQDALLVEDSRDGQLISREFAGLEKELLLLGESAPRREETCLLLQDRGYSPQAVETAIEELVESQLLLNLDGHLLTLAILGDCKPLADNEHQIFPELKL